MPPTESRLDIKSTPAGFRSRVVTIRGEIDLATRSTLVGGLLAAVTVPGGGRVLIDLDGITFFGADGLRALDEARNRAAATGTIVHTTAAAHTPAGRLLDRTDWVHSPGPQPTADPGRVTDTA